jgi:hypothetical protein
LEKKKKKNPLPGLPDPQNEKSLEVALLYSQSGEVQAHRGKEEQAFQVGKEGDDG